MAFGFGNSSGTETVNAVLQLQNVSVEYPDKTQVIRGVSLSLQAGENIALAGGNGAGKTTLLLAAVGVLPLAHGEISLCGLPLTKKTAGAFQKKIGVVFQNPDDQLFMPLVFDDLAFGCRNLGLPENETAARINETLAQLHISHLRARSSLKLSCGEKRMAAIAAVLVMQPDILIFDEPTAFLDPKSRRVLIETLKTLHHPKIIATHDLSFAAEVCNRAVILFNGKIAADGSPDLFSDKKLLQECGLE